MWKRPVDPEVILPGQVVLGHVRKLAKHEPVSEPVNSVPPWFLFQVPAECLP